MCSNNIYEMVHFPFDKVAITTFAVDRASVISARFDAAGRPVVCFPDHKKSHNIDCCASGDINKDFCLHF